jgi:hypothetical protein
MTAALAVLVPGTVIVALTVNSIALAAWIRRQWQYRREKESRCRIPPAAAYFQSPCRRHRMPNA